jgi:ABC-type Fe3+-hydroxamate transport system substrate-binding protein/adenosylcobinamide amidohydrolase
MIRGFFYAGIVLEISIFTAVFTSSMEVGNTMKYRRSIVILVAMVVCLWIGLPVYGAYQVRFTDTAGRQVEIDKTPRRVVSLVPTITEMLMRLGAADRVVGITYHSVLPPACAGKNIVGGFLHPDPGRVTDLKPDLVFYAGLQEEIPAALDGKTHLVDLESSSIEDAFSHLRLLGEIFHCEAAAARIIAEEERQLKVVAAKIGKILAVKRKRVIRLMGRTEVMTPGNDSFQNEYIRRAGGIAPDFGRQGSIVSVSLEEWQRFNPQVIYACGGDRQAAELLERPGWREVEAVKNGRLYFFPCDLTCRAATHPGSFTSWLAARIYGEEFENLANNVLPEKIVSQRQLSIDLGYVKRARIVESDIRDFRNLTLVLDFNRPLGMVSTLEGEKQGVKRVANHYFPPPSWGLGHDLGLDGLRSHTLKVLGLDPATTAILFTGADMNNLAVVKKKYRDLSVYALVTAGVHSNAVRMAEDIGRYYEPGTINMIILANTRLSRRAMTRAIISATEAKSAALADLDIRSSYTPLENQATGTGTDNIIVVEGEGISIDNAGGHSKMGELIARAVYQGVFEAVHRQNGLVADRSVFQRLKERNINILSLAAQSAPEGMAGEMRRETERLLLQPEYAALIESCMAISDDYQRGLVADIGFVDFWCREVAGRIAGHEISGSLEVDCLKSLPPVMERCLAALFCGAKARLSQ